MKLFEIKADYSITMTLNNIVRKQKADNIAEFMVMARTLQAIQQGQVPASLYDQSIQTSKEVTDFLKQLSATDIVKLASELILHLNGYQVANCIGWNTNEWINFFLKREATD